MMNRILKLALIVSVLVAETGRARTNTELLTVPEVVDAAPAAGIRVRQFNSEYRGSGVYHALYLPTDWKPGGTYPVIVEFAGNKWKTSAGTVEGSSLGYGISAGKGVIWICMPYVNLSEMKNQLNWWGDVDATVAYCKHTVDRVCKEYGGDPNNVFIAGFSRGAIACNFIGLHDDDIAAIWRGFICHSHYDGVRTWRYEGSDRASAAIRLKRLGNRPQFISHENSVDETRKYLETACPSGRFTFVPLPGVAHTDTWVLRDSPQRQQLRNWFRRSLTTSDPQPKDALD